MSRSPSRPLTANRLMARMAWRRKGRLAVGWTLLSLHQACEVAVPIAIGVTIDTAVATGDLTRLVLCAVGTAMLFVVLSLAWRFGARQSVIVLENETHRLRMMSAQRALDPRGHSTGLSTGEILAIATSDAEKAALVIRAASLGVASIVAVIASAGALLWIDVPLGLGVLLGVPILLVILQAVAPRLSRRSAEAQEASAATTGLATDLVTGMRTLRGIGATAAAADRYRDSSRSALAAALRAVTWTGAFQAITVGLSGLFLAGVAAVAGWFTLTGRLSIGELITVVGLAQFIAEPMRTLGQCGQLLAIAKASAGRVVNLLTSAPAVEDTGVADPGGDAVGMSLHKVNHRGLTDVTFTVEPGSMVGVVCHDPVDADALLRLLNRKVPDDDYTGSITLGEHRIEDVPLDRYRSIVHIEPHDVTLFEGDIASNIVVSPPDGVDIDTLAAASITAAAADDVIDDHPDGMTRHIADHGKSLSGGQRQRLGLARALAADPPVLVLHDPTTAVDSATEELVAEGLRTLRAGRSTMVVTGSPALLGKTDHVVVIADGRVTHTGGHDELLETVPDYRKAVLR